MNKETDKKPSKKSAALKTFVIGSTKYRTYLTSKFENRKKWEVKDPRKILAYIPGTIHSVYVEKGQEVREGDPLVILEAMKMRNVVTFPADGIVKNLNVKAGDIIPKGHMIAELE